MRDGDGVWQLRIALTLSMSTDPYHTVKSEIETSLQAAGTLRASYLRIRSTAREGSEELDWARNEACTRF